MILPIEIKAVFRRGAFVPLEPVDLPEGTRVLLRIESIEDDAQDNAAKREGPQPASESDVNEGSG